MFDDDDDDNYFICLFYVIDKLRWYCEGCKNIVYEESFHCYDLGTQLKPIIEKYANHKDLRLCKKCGHVNSAK